MRPASAVLLLLCLHHPGSSGAAKQNCNSVLSNQLASFENTPSSSSSSAPLVPYIYERSRGRGGPNRFSRLRVEELVGQTGSNSTPQSCDHYWKVENYRGEDGSILQSK